MRAEEYSFVDLLIFLGIVASFIIFGQSLGWRLVGIYQLFFTFNIIREKKVGIGYLGFIPSSYVKGNLTILVGLVSLGIAVALIVFPERTIMRLF
jgi:hypothetical protein